MSSSRSAGVSSSSSSSSSVNNPSRGTTAPPRNVPLPQSRQNDVIVATVQQVPEESKESLSTWLATIYDINSATDDLIKEMWEAFSYKGFNREDVLKQLHGLVKENKRLAIELIVISALRGPQAASNLKLSNGRTPKELGIPASAGQGTKILTLNKIQAATADLAAFYLKKMNVPKRMNLPLPGWLQFPSAGAIKMPRELREMHLDFARRFSGLIGGVFQEQIYVQMEHNSYLDEKLALFNDIKL